MLKTLLGLVGAKLVRGRAGRCVSDAGRTQRLTDAAEKKAGLSKGRIASMFGSVKALVRMVRAWVSGRYRVVPWKSVVMAVGGLLYFVFPIDIFPDFIPLIGFFDDAAVLAYIVGVIRDDLDAFILWEQKQKNEELKSGAVEAG